MYVAYTYLQIFLHFCSPQQLLGLVFVPLGAGICCWRSSVFLPPLLIMFIPFCCKKILGSIAPWWFECINCASTLTTFLSFLSICTFLLHKFHLHSDFDLVLVSIPLFLPCLVRPFLLLNFLCYISDIELVFVFLSLITIVFVFVSIPLFLPCLSYLDPFVAGFPPPSLT